MSTPVSDAQFAEAIAGWDERIPCEWTTTNSGKPCRRPANWDLDMHGCYNGLICGHHYWAWHRSNIGRRYCRDCDTRFASFPDAFTARKL